MADAARRRGPSSGLYQRTRWYSHRMAARPAVHPRWLSDGHLACWEVADLLVPSATPSTVPGAHERVRRLASPTCRPSQASVERFLALIAAAARRASWHD